MSCIFLTECFYYTCCINFYSCTSSVFFFEMYAFYSCTRYKLLCDYNSSSSYPIQVRKRSVFFCSAFFHGVPDKKVTFFELYAFTMNFYSRSFDK